MPTTEITIEARVAVRWRIEGEQVTVESVEVSGCTLGDTTGLIKAIAEHAGAREAASP